MNKIVKTHLAGLTDEQRELYTERTHELAKNTDEKHWFWQFLDERLHAPVKTSAKEALISQCLEHLHHMNAQPLVLLSSNRRVLFANQHAARYLGGSWFSVHKGFLQGKTPALEDELALTFENLPVTGDSVACALRSEPNDLFITIDTLKMTDDNQQDSRILVLRVHERLVAEQINEGYLKTWYNLSPTEAKLAVAFATGTTLSEFARRRNVGMTTVRSQFARVKLKLGASDQAEVVSKVLVAVEPNAQAE